MWELITCIMEFGTLEARMVLARTCRYLYLTYCKSALGFEPWAPIASLPDEDLAKYKRFLFCGDPHDVEFQLRRLPGHCTGVMFSPLRQDDKERIKRQLSNYRPKMINSREYPQLTEVRILGMWIHVPIVWATLTNVEIVQLPAKIGLDSAEVRIWYARLSEIRPLIKLRRLIIAESNLPINHHATEVCVDPPPSGAWGSPISKLYLRMVDKGIEFGGFASLKELHIAHGNLSDIRIDTLRVLKCTIYLGAWPHVRKLKYRRIYCAGLFWDNLSEGGKTVIETARTLAGIPDSFNTPPQHPEHYAIYPIHQAVVSGQVWLFNTPDI